MKRTLITTAMIACMVISIPVAFGQNQDKKSEKARENLKDAKKEVVEAKKEVSEAKKDSISDYQKFKKESEAKIKSNDKKIADLKAKHVKMSAAEDTEYQKKISDLGVKNDNLNKKLQDYNNNEGQDKWVSFKTEFKHDMDELGKALKDFTVNNKK